MTTMGFIGVGEIASAIVEGLAPRPEHPGFFLSPRNAERSTVLASTIEAAEVCESNQGVVDHSDLIILAVLPQQVEGVLGKLEVPAESAPVISDDDAQWLL